MREVRNPRRATRRRLLAGGLATSALAAGLATVLVLGPTAEVDGTPPVSSAGEADATTILLRAATSAATQPALKPRPNQFLYVESKSYQAMTGFGEGQPAQQAMRIHRRVWLSVSGKRAGLLRNTGNGQGPRDIWLCDSPEAQEREIKSKRDKLPPKVDLNDPPGGCVGSPAIDPGLPTEPKAMLNWLYRNSQGGNPPDVQAFVTVGDTLREKYVSPAALAAIFRAAAKIPGTTVTRDVVDLLGRKGVAVGQTWHGSRQELIFDPKTYRLLGERVVASYDNTFRPKGGKTPDAKPWTPDPAFRKNHKEGAILYSTATLRVAVTDRVGQSPA